MTFISFITCHVNITTTLNPFAHFFFLKVILQLAESGSFFGQVDLFKVRGKFALSDAYEDHFMLPKGKIIVVTHRRVMLLQVSFLDKEHKCCISFLVH
jgi:hypothetical protein